MRMHWWAKRPLRLLVLLLVAVALAVAGIGWSSFSFSADGVHLRPGDRRWAARAQCVVPPPVPMTLPENETDVVASVELYEQVASVLIEGARDASAVLDGRVLCVIAAVDTEKSKGQVRAQHETWVHDVCDGYIAYGDYDDPQLGVVHVAYDKPKDQKSLWHKLQAGIRHLAARRSDCYTPFTWFLFADDDTYVIPANFARCLARFQDNGTALALGRRFKNPDLLFLAGGAGMVLNVQAMDAILSDPHFYNDLWAEPLDTGLSRLFPTAGVSVPDTRDADGRHVFHMFNPPGHLLYEPRSHVPDTWVYDYSKFDGPDYRFGLDYFSPHSATFHYLSPAAMRLFHRLLHD